ncbi:hypothetical protein [Gordonia sp. (in: high G+C Gram-positive bacteria)]|uniref:hypothetical protein n=1 Tax=Gordonia sp. (in: high G+C Gram-positive bacteria) TaxID=84139 RepID=UPI0039E61798
MFTALQIAIVYLRRNTRQLELAEHFGCSQPTVSRAITLTPWTERAPVRVRADHRGPPGRGARHRRCDATPVLVLG